MMTFRMLAALVGATLITTLPAQAQSSTRNSVGGGGGGSSVPSGSSLPSVSSPPSQFQPGPQGFSNSAVPFPQQMPQQVFPSGAGAGSAQNQGGSVGVPNSELNDEIWNQHDPNSQFGVDHSAWDYFLSRYVVTDARGLNRVNYRGVTRSDYQVLCEYLGTLQSTDVRVLNRAEQLAFWFNLYNAKTVSLVIQNRPWLSVRQIKSSLLDVVGPFDDKVLNVLGRSLSLTDVESGIIRPVFKDPRIHYALNCASVGCPNLSRTAWTSANLGARLDRAAYDFINSGRAVKVGVFGVNASKIYDWYKDDFGGTEQAVLQHIWWYANPSTRQQLSGARGFHRYYYDWSLNQAGRGSNLYGILLP